MWFLKKAIENYIIRISHSVKVVEHRKSVIWWKITIFDVDVYNGNFTATEQKVDADEIWAKNLWIISWAKILL